MRTLEEIAADVRRIAEELRSHGNTTARDRAEELSRTAYRLDFEAGPMNEFEPMPTATETPPKRDPKPADVLRFNTGRMYSREGQRIVAFYHEPSRRIYFQDLDRNIDGIIRTPNVDRTQFHKTAIMRQYDAGNYDSITRQTLDMIGLTSD